MITGRPLKAKKYMWNRLNRITKVQWTAIILLSIALLYFAIPPGSPVFNGDYSTVIRSESGKLLHVFVNKDQQWHFPPDTLPVPEKLKIAVVTFEDESFYSHIGIDFKAVARAVWQNFSNKRIISGASTIPMQVARMRAHRKRTYINKIGESVYAVRLTIHNKKDEILKLYLDHAPYGGNVIGYRTASMKFFGKEADELTWSEAATLAVLPNAPGLIYPAKTSSLLKPKRDLLLKKLFEKGFIGEQTYELAMLEPIPDRFISFESIAPHLSRRLKNENPQKKIITTTINEEIQRQCNQIATALQRELFILRNL